MRVVASTVNTRSSVVLIPGLPFTCLVPIAPTEFSANLHPSSLHELTTRLLIGCDADDVQGGPLDHGWRYNPQGVEVPWFLAVSIAAWPYFWLHSISVCHLRSLALSSSSFTMDQSLLNVTNLGACLALAGTVFHYQVLVTRSLLFVQRQR